MALIALAAQGCLRGVGDLRTPLVIVIAANVANIVLEVLLVYGFGTGASTARGRDGHRAGRDGRGVRGACCCARRRHARARTSRASARWRRIGAVLVRAQRRRCYACFTLATAVSARIGAPSLGAHQIAFQLFISLALVLDAIAIAGQVIVGRALGAGDVDGAFARPRGACSSGRSSPGCCSRGGLLALADVAPARVHPRPGRDRPRARHVAAVLPAACPPAALVFALDGILIGAGDARFLAVRDAVSPSPSSRRSCSPPTRSRWSGSRSTR